MGPVLLVGPTAVGKTAVALELARRVDAEIVSADSMQVYRGMDIGTAKPSPAEQAEVRHHLIDVVEIDEPFDVKRFVDLAANAIQGIQKRGKTPVVVGGTGLYVRALRRGLFEGPGRDPKLRAKLELMSTETLYGELQRVDPVTAAKIDRKNPRRLVRALEVFYATGKPISKFQGQWESPHLGPLPRGERKKPSPRLRGEGLGERFAVCLDRERRDLYARIEKRIDEQIASGWVEEVRQLLKRGLEKNRTAMQAAGYRELVAHLAGKVSLPEAVALIKTRTRQLARRQLTWFRHEPNLVWVTIEAGEPPAGTAQRVMEAIERKEQDATH